MAHLSPVFDELADSFDALAENMAALNMVASSLDDFNESFAAFLYGLRVNAYTTDFPEAPNKINFEIDARRRRKQAAEQSALDQDNDAATEDHEDDDLKDIQHSSRSASVASFSTSGRGGTTSRGRGRGGIGRAGKPMTAARRRERLVQWASTVIDTLEIKYREEQPFRSEMEAVLIVLRTNADGL